MVKQKNFRIGDRVRCYDVNGTAVGYDPPADFSEIVYRRCEAALRSVASIQTKEGEE